MSMSPAYHLLGKAMNGEALNENQVRQIVGVIRKDERLKERERIVRLIQDTYEDVAYQERGSLEWTGDVIELIQT